MISIGQIIDKIQWESFVKAQNEYTFLHSWNWGEFNQLMGNKIWQLGLFEDNTLIGVALIIKITAKRGTFLFCPHGPIITKHETYNTKQILETLLKELKKLAKEENCSFIRVSPLMLKTEENRQIFFELGFRKAPIHIHAESSLLLDITKPKDELLKNMRKTTRYLIRRAEAAGIKIEKEDPAKGQEFLRLQKEVAKRQHFMPFSKQHISSEIKAFTPDNQLIIFNARYNHEIIASAIIIFYGDRAFYYQAASSHQYEKIPAPYLLLWQAILEAKDHGCRIFDFYGASPEGKTRHPWYGPTLFKKGFGGFRIDYLPTQDLILNWKYWFTFIIETTRRIKRGF